MNPKIGTFFVFPIPRSLLLFMPDVGEARSVVYLMNKSAPYKSVNKKTKRRKFPRSLLFIY